MADKRPSIFRIAWVDYRAFLSVVFFLITSAVYLYDLFTKETFEQNANWFIFGILFLSLAGFVSRCVSIVSIYNDGIEARATVSGAAFFRDRGHLQCIYPFQGKKYQSTMYVMKNKYTKRYKVGDEVIVLVNRNNPKKAAIRDLFI